MLIDDPEALSDTGKKKEVKLCTMCFECYYTWLYFTILNVGYSYTIFGNLMILITGKL